MTLYRNYCCIKPARLWGWMGYKHFHKLLRMRLHDGCQFPSPHPHNARERYQHLQFVILFYTFALPAVYSLGVIDPPILRKIFGAMKEDIPKSDPKKK